MGFMATKETQSHMFKIELGLSHFNMVLKSIPNMNIEPHIYV